MRPDPQMITLGEMSFSIRPLTLKQVRAIERVMSSSESSIGLSIEIIRIGLDRDHAEAAAQIDDIEASGGDAAQAMAVILRLGGFLQESAPGEEQAAGTETPSGGMSTAA